MKDAPITGLLLWVWFIASGLCFPFVFAASIKYISAQPIKPTTVNYNTYTTRHETITENKPDCRFNLFNRCSGDSN